MYMMTQGVIILYCMLSICLLLPHASEQMKAEFDENAQIFQIELPTSFNPSIYQRSLLDE
jgi:hypothetical protein